MEYDKHNKKRIVIDYHNNEINNYLFDTNKFSLENKKEIMKHKNKQLCGKYALEKNYEGFIYTGNKNKCFLFNTDQFNKKIDQEMLDKYNVKRFKKTNYENDFNDYETQNNSINYFKNKNHYNFDFQNKIKEFDTSNVKECLDECKNNADCKNALYFEQPKECHFYKNKVFKNKNDVNYENKNDTYTLKKSIKNSDINHKKFIDNIDINDDSKIIKDKDININDNFKYSSCTTIPQYTDMKEMNNEFNKICKKTYGDAYIFNQKDDDMNIIQCNKNQIKIRCIYKLDNVIENFSNNGLEMNSNIGTSTNIYIYITLFLFIIFIIILIISFV
jgi:hypothetical protein